MATYVKFNATIEHIYEGVHNFATGALTVVLLTHANIPTYTTNAVLADITPITMTNLSGRVLTQSSSSQTSGTYKLVIADLVLTASAAVPTFRHVVIYNDTPTSPADPLVCGFDHGSDVTLATAETYTLDMDGSAGLIQAA